MTNQDVGKAGKPWWKKLLQLLRKGLNKADEAGLLNKDAGPGKGF